MTKRKIHPDARSALAGLLREGMMVMSGGLGLCGIPSLLIEAVRQDDRVACDLWDETCRYLSIGLGNAITILAPDVLIIGGGISAAGDLLLDPLRELIPNYVSMIPPECIRIEPAALGQDSGLYGAVALARSSRARRSTSNAG